MKRKRVLGVVTSVMIVIIAPMGIAAAQSSSSPNYQVDESFIGNGGAVDSSSANYSANESVGDTAVGEGSSTNFQTQSGTQSTNEPRLIFTVGTSTINFGALSTSATATATSTFSVLNYTSYGYVVQTLGTPPSSGAHSLAAMSSTGPSITGTEQYGINLVANTAPTTFGANPSQVPSGTFSSGAVASGYNTANNFRYVNGETIASAAASSGQTDYTIAYIINASTSTPGGSYTGSQSLICTGTY